MLERMWRNMNTFTLLVGVYISSTIVEDSVAIPQGPRNTNFIWPSNPITGYISKVYKSFYYQDTCTWIFTAALFTTAKTWNQSKCPSMIDWTGKMWRRYTMEYYVAIRNDQFMSFVGTWMNLETIILSKLTQEQKSKHHMFSFIGRYWTMRTHGHREGASHTGVCRGEIGDEQWLVGWIMA